MIEIKDLTLERGGRTIVRNFSCTIAQGEITAIVGANGAGKSTLLSAIAGEKYWSSGEILLNKVGLDSYTSQALANIRAVAQQSHNYWMAYTAGEIIALGNENTPPARAKFLFDALDIHNFLDQKVTMLSGGELQRVEIARAFMRELPLVLLDEPLASQDITSIDRIKKFLIHEKELGRSIVMVAHARPEELAWCDQIITIETK